MNAWLVSAMRRNRLRTNAHWIGFLGGILIFYLLAARARYLYVYKHIFENWGSDSFAIKSRDTALWPTAASKEDEKRNKRSWIEVLQSSVWASVSAYVIFDFNIGSSFSGSAQTTSVLQRQLSYFFWQQIKRKEGKWKCGPSFWLPSGVLDIVVLLGNNRNNCGQNRQQK